jgi:ankyrin repeat protein
MNSKSVRKGIAMKKPAMIVVLTALIFTSPVLGQDIFQSIRNEAMDEVKEFFETNPDKLEIQDRNRMTPLMYASFFGKTEAAAYLIKKGADVNYSRGGESCLHQAAQMNHPEIVALLLDNGADMEISKPRTPLYYALSSGAKEAVSLLIERGAFLPVDNGLFHKAVVKGISAAVDHMVAKGVDLSSRNGTGGTLLHSAAEGGMVTLAELMLTKGSDINAPNDYGRCPIHLAAMKGHLNVVEQLLNKGADRDIKTPTGATAYDLAHKNGHQKVCDFLAGRGAQVREMIFMETPGDPYFGLKRPGSRAEYFAVGIISSSDELEHGVPVWSSDKTEVYWSALSKSYYMKNKEGKWTLPSVSPLFQKYRASHITFSPDGKRLFFDTISAMDGTEKKKDSDIWYMEKRGDKDVWSEPVNPGPSVNSGKADRTASVAANGNLYFASDYDLYRSVCKNGRYMPREKLDQPINTEHYELSCFIAPDESFLLFSSNRPGRDGQSRGLNTFICFKNGDDSWTEPIGFGTDYGVEENFFITMSSDGAYIFFGAGDVQWIDAGIIQTLRKRALER